MEHLIGFIAGASFGATSVVVGQPLDTIKTRMQAHQASLKSNPITVASEVFRKEGLRGLYRGGFPILVGGATFRSAQFGVYAAALGFAQHTSHEGGAPRISDKKLLGCINPQVVFAGFWGGVARGVVEGPFEYIKVCRQINVPWRFRKLYVLLVLSEREGGGGWREREKWSIANSGGEMVNLLASISFFVSEQIPRQRNDHLQKLVLVWVVRDLPGSCQTSVW